MKTLHYVFTFLAWTLLFVGQAYAGTEIHMKADGTKLQLDIDDDGVMQVKGLPFAGAYYYDAKRKVLIVSHPEEKHTYYLPVGLLEIGQPADLVTPEDQKNKKFAKYKSNRWDVKVGNKICGEMFGSKELAGIAQIDVSDLSKFNLGLAELYGIDTNRAECDFFRFMTASGKLVGFPTYMKTKFGETTVTEVARDVIIKHKYANPRPLDEASYVRFLKRMLKPQLQKAFEKNSEVHGDNPEIQIKALKTLLSEPSNRG